METKPVETLTNEKTKSNSNTKILPWKRFFKYFIYVMIPIVIIVIVLTLVMSSIASLNPNEVD
jgi:hypothetical protein